MTTNARRTSSTVLIDEFVLSVNSSQKCRLKGKRKREEKDNNYSPTKRMKQNKKNSLPETMAAKEFLVETILGKRKHNGTWQYLIKWDGYGPKFNTWEDEDNLNCSDLVIEFENKMGSAKNENAKEEEEERGFEVSLGRGQDSKIGLEFGDEIQEVLNVQVVDNQLMYFILCVKEVTSVRTFLHNQ
jgi:hypothetical protein